MGARWRRGGWWARPVAGALLAAALASGAVAVKAGPGAYDGIYQIVNGDGSAGDFVSVHAGGSGGKVIATIYRSADPVGAASFSLTDGGASVAALYKWGSWDLYEGALSGNAASLSGYSQYGLCNSRVTVSFGAAGGSIRVAPDGLSDLAGPGAPASACDASLSYWPTLPMQRLWTTPASATVDGIYRITNKDGSPGDYLSVHTHAGGGVIATIYRSSAPASPQGFDVSQAGARVATLARWGSWDLYSGTLAGDRASLTGYAHDGLCKATGGIAFGQPQSVTVTPGGASEFAPAGPQPLCEGAGEGALAMAPAYGDTSGGDTSGGGSPGGGGGEIGGNGGNGDGGGGSEPEPGPVSHTLTITPPSGGAVSDGGAIDCTSAGAGACAASYSAGTRVSLTASAGSGYAFSGWGGDCSGSLPSASVVMDQDRRCSARFTENASPPPPAPAQVKLTLNLSGQGKVGDGAAFTCASSGSQSCSALYDAHSSVTLTATPATGYVFQTWSGGCGSSADLSATVNLGAADVTCGAVFAVAETVSGPPQPRVAGNRLTDARTGLPWAPHGASVPSLEYACVQGWAPNANFTQAGAEAMASWGMDVVRFPLNEDCWLGADGAPTSGSGTAAQYRARVAEWVGWAHQAGMAVIFDLHWSAPPGYYGIDQLSMTDSQSVTFWQQVAAAYRDDPSVMFELFNEPYEWSGLTWNCWANGGCLLPVTNQSGGWAPGSASGSATFPVSGMKALVAAVRGAGAGQPVIVNGLNYANDLTGWLANAPDDAQTIAGWHAYKDQGCAAACRDSTVAAVAAKVPVLITEFGYEPGDPAYFGQLMDWADARGIGYLPWAWWWNAGTGPYQLLSDAAFTPTAGEGQAFKNHLAGLAGH